MEKRSYKIFREENGRKVIDLFVTIEDGLITLDEKVNGVNFEKVNLNQFSEKLKSLKLEKEVEKEIQKAVLNKHIGLLEEKKAVVEKATQEESVDQMLTLKRKDMLTKWKQHFEDIEKEFSNFETEFDNLFDF